jgi:hypothetical protein
MIIRVRWLLAWRGIHLIEQLWGLNYLMVMFVIWTPWLLTNRLVISIRNFSGRPSGDCLIWRSLWCDRHGRLVSIEGLVILRIASLSKLLNPFLLLSRFIKSIHLFLDCSILDNWLLITHRSYRNTICSKFRSEGAFLLMFLVLIVLFSLIFFILLRLREPIKLFIFGLGRAHKLAFVNRLRYNALGKVSLSSSSLRFESTFLHFLFFQNLFSLVSPSFLVACGR